MDSKEKKHELISNAYTSIKKGEEYIHILDTDKITDMGTQNAILDIQRELNIGFEMSYEVMADACQELSEIDFRDLEGTEFQGEYASVYIYDRLQYLDGNNQDDITDIVKEYSCDIQTACAVWYDNQVNNACEALRAYIMQ